MGNSIFGVKNNWILYKNVSEKKWKFNEKYKQKYI